MRKVLLWSLAGLFLGMALLGAHAAALAADGKAVYTDKCAPCHGDKGDGKGPMAVTFSPPPGNFCDPKFWQGDVAKKISDSVKNGKGQMVPVDLKPDEIKAVTEYITKTCKR